MSPVTHLLTGWLTAQAADLSRRDRALVTLSGVVPDIDALGVVVELLPPRSVSQSRFRSGACDASYVACRQTVDNLSAGIGGLPSSSAR
jgi:hypothetical protein